MPNINTLVDLFNAFVLRNTVIGALFDEDFVNGPTLTLSPATGEESNFASTSPDDKLNKNEILLLDGNSQVLGLPLAGKQVKSTMLTLNTGRVVGIFLCPASSFSKEKLSELVNELSRLIITHCSLPTSSGELEKKTVQFLPVD